MSGFAPAEFQLAMRYMDGAEVGQDTSRAIDWFERAGRNGFSRAFFHLGLIYEHGLGIRRDRRKAREQYTWGAAGGSALCEAALADLEGR